MDDFPGRHAYRCLPMAIANAYGWEVLAPGSFAVDWTGGPDRQDIRFRALGDFPGLPHFVASNFSHGIVTFHTGYMFRTPPGWQLLATGPFNRAKHGIAPLTGVIETDWLPYPFTMNWQLTRPGTVRFEKGEPFCLIFPVAQGAMEPLIPEIRALEDEPDLKQQYEHWREKRAEFLQRMEQLDAGTLKQAWQKFYFKGELPEAAIKAPAHSNKLRLATPVDARGRNGRGGQ